MKRKLFTKIFVITVILSLCCFQASASQYSVTDKGKGVLTNGETGDYSDDWEKTDYFDSERGIMIYGFDTFAFNEDYCKCFHTTKSHSAYVFNATYGGQTTSTAAKGTWSKKAETRHAAKPTWAANY
ncbi:MAG: hypothetical protein ACI4JR_02190 [Acutalibacteraceae bacterium]